VASFPPLPAGLPLDAAEWEQTPPGVRQVVLQQQTTIQHLEARIKTLEARIAELEARLQQRSQNSDRPPSSDPPYEKRTARAGVSVASVQETTIRWLSVDMVEENEGLLPQIPPMKTPNSSRT
jgi:uncharacterized coiled-coil protein SlyX